MIKKCTNTMCKKLRGGCRNGQNCEKGLTTQNDQYITGKSKAFPSLKSPVSFAMHRVNRRVCK